MKPVYFFILAITAPCTLADDNSDNIDAESELGKVRLLIESKHYQQAIAALDLIVEQHYRNADAWNLLGYTHRLTGNYSIAADAYNKALLNNPDHKGALEYQGELFIELNNLASAKANLYKLQALCPNGCEELTDLEKALAAQ